MHIFRLLLSVVCLTLAAPGHTHERSWPDVDARWACASRHGDSVQWHWGWTEQEALTAARRRADFYRDVKVNPADCHSERHKTALDLLEEGKGERSVAGIADCYVAPDCMLSERELGRLRTHCDANPSSIPEVCFQIGR